MSYNLAYVLAYRGEPDRAFEWLEKAVKYRDTALGATPFDPMLESLHSDPRWLPLLRRLERRPSSSRRSSSTSRCRSSRGSTSVVRRVPMANQKKRGPPPKGSRPTRQRTSPAFVTPMAAQVVKTLPEGDDWVYELKFDGYRALVIKDEQRVELRSRKNKDLTGMYRGIAAAGQRLKADQAVVDGEIVALDAQGSPSFQALQHRGSHAAHQIVFYAFDLLHLDGTDLTSRATAAAPSPTFASARRIRASGVRGIARRRRSDR